MLWSLGGYTGLRAEVVHCFHNLEDLYNCIFVCIYSFAFSCSECYRRIEHLRDRRDVLNESLNEDMKSKAGKREQDAESDDEELLSVMIGQNWREKGAFL